MEDDKRQGGIAPISPIRVSATQWGSPSPVRPPARPASTLRGVPNRLGGGRKKGSR